MGPAPDALSREQPRGRGGRGCSHLREVNGPQSKELSASQAEAGASSPHPACPPGTVQWGPPAGAPIAHGPFPMPMVREPVGPFTSRGGSGLKHQGHSRLSRPPGSRAGGLPGLSLIHTKVTTQRAQCRGQPSRWRCLQDRPPPPEPRELGWGVSSEVSVVLPLSSLRQGAQQLSEGGRGHGAPGGGWRPRHGPGRRGPGGHSGGSSRPARPRAPVLASASSGLWVCPVSGHLSPAHASVSLSHRGCCQAWLLG